MKKPFFMLLLMFIMLSALSVCVAAEGVAPVTTGPADTGDLFGVVIVMLLASAMGVAALVSHKTRFDQEDKKKADG